MAMSSLNQQFDLSDPLQDQSILSQDSQDTSFNETLQIQDDATKKYLIKTSKDIISPVPPKPRYNSSLVCLELILAIASTTIYLYVRDTTAAGIISVLGAVVLITGFWIVLFEDNTFSQEESRRMRKLTGAILYTAFGLSIIAFVIAMADISKTYIDANETGDSLDTEDYSTSSSKQDSLYETTRACEEENLCSGTLETDSSDSFAEFLNSNPILIAMIVLASIQFAVFLVLIWTTRSSEKALERKPTIYAPNDKKNNNPRELELRTFAQQTSGLYVIY